MMLTDVLEVSCDAELGLYPFSGCGEVAILYILATKWLIPNHMVFSVTFISLLNLILVIHS